MNFSGRQSNQALAYTAIKKLMDDTGKKEVAVSVRDLAVSIGCSAMSASRSLNGLVKRGYLIRVRSSEKDKAAIYKLSENVTHIISISNNKYVTLSEKPEATFIKLNEPDVWEGKATAFRVYHSIYIGAVSVKQVASATGLSKSTIYDNLNGFLLPHGLVDRHGRELAIGRATAESVRESAGKDGMTEAKQLKHQQDREEYEYKTLFSFYPDVKLRPAHSVSLLHKEEVGVTLSETQLVDDVTLLESHKSLSELDFYWKYGTYGRNRIKELGANCMK